MAEMAEELRHIDKGQTMCGFYRHICAVQAALTSWCGILIGSDHRHRWSPDRARIRAGAADSGRSNKATGAALSAWRGQPYMLAKVAAARVAPCGDVAARISFGSR